MKNIPVRKLTEVPKESIPQGRFTLRTVQDLLGEKDLFHELHRHDFFFILALKKGMGTHEIDFTNYPIKDNVVFFLRPGQVHQLELKTGSTGFIMEFNTEFYEPPKKIYNKNFCQLDSDPFAKLQTILQYMFEEHTNRQEGYTTILKANLTIFFTELLRQSITPGIQNKISTYQQERLDAFLSLLEKHSAKHKQVAWYTDSMNLSAYQLNEITKSLLDKTASDIINDHIILEAKRYLLATTNQIKEIADHLGYEDVSYFIRFFKKHTGHAPEAFRNNSR